MKQTFFSLREPYQDYRDCTRNPVSFRTFAQWTLEEAAEEDRRNRELIPDENEYDLQDYL
jgi:hypothetical protein